MVLAAREEVLVSEAVAEGWVFTRGDGVLVERFGGGWFCGWLTEWVRHAESVAVCFDEVAAFDVGLEV